MQHVSAVTGVRNRLAAVVDGLAQLIKGLPIDYMERHGDGFVFIGPDYYWGELSAEQRAVQIGLKRDYEQIWELLRLLLSQAPEDLVRQLEDADKKLRVWLELGTNWSLSANSAENEKALRSDAEALRKVLDILAVTGPSELILIPDTNTLLVTPDPTQYRGVAGQDRALPSCFCRPYSVSWTVSRCSTEIPTCAKKQRGRSAKSKDGANRVL